MDISIVYCLIAVLMLLLVILLTTSIRIVREDMRLAVYRLGRYVGDKGPGLVLLIPIVDKGILKKPGIAEATPSTKMVGIQGETTTSVFRDGKVTLPSGEEWDAISQTPISTGRPVRVVRMILEVEEE
jgi:hypothetical protein